MYVCMYEEGNYHVNRYSYTVRSVSKSGSTYVKSEESTDFFSIGLFSRLEVRLGPSKMSGEFKPVGNVHFRAFKGLLAAI